MGVYVYRSYNADMVNFSGSRPAASGAEVAAFLDSKELRDYEVMKSETRYSARKYGLAGPKDLAVFCRQMSVVFFSEITLMEGVALLAGQTGNKQLKTALNEIHALMEGKAYTFAEAAGMYPHVFGHYLINMINIGEGSGTLETVFSRMAVYFEKEDGVRRRIRTAITYPVVLTALMLAIIVFLIVKILPMFSDILVSIGGEPMGFTAAVLSVQRFITGYFRVIVSALAGAAVLAAVFLRSGAGARSLARARLSLPFGRVIYVKTLASRIARSLSLLLGGGIQLLNALEEVKRLIDNEHVEKKFDRAIGEVRDGSDLADALKNTGVFPELFIKMTLVGQKTGRMDEMLDRSAAIFDAEVDEAIEKLTTMLEPALIIILSVIVGVILVSVMLPMINIMNNIG